MTSPRSMRLLPEKKPKAVQKVAVADQTGVLQCFNMKKGEPVVSITCFVILVLSTFLSSVQQNLKANHSCGIQSNILCIARADVIPLDHPASRWLEAV